MKSYFWGEDARRVAIDALSQPKGKRPRRMILSVKRDDYQLFIDIKDDVELEILPPDGTEIVERDDSGK